MTVPVQKPLSLDELKQTLHPIRDITREFTCKMSALDRFALWITERVGTIGFFLIIVGWTILWLGWNTLAPKPLQFDPPMGFVLWLFISNLIQLLLMPLIMVGQNVQGRYAELRAQNDLDVNVRAEEEIEVILRHLEYQNTILIAMMEKMDCEMDEKRKL